eukprot:TRINITY_DN377_c0_g1_i1.p1 TRINITY_DN377_c0_g1~~TRINITY_DN377_c0_g1_i1.p1  ORF type:complete len:80 (+),score=25.16 TRINITY_DN377_c0_g1_i1:2-241(+)
MDTSDVGSPSPNGTVSRHPSLRLFIGKLGGGMVTVQEVAEMERQGEDISDFQIPKSEDISEVPVPDAPLTIGYFKGVFL